MLNEHEVLREAVRILGSLLLTGMGALGAVLWYLQTRTISAVESLKQQSAQKFDVVSEKFQAVNDAIAGTRASMERGEREIVDQVHGLDVRLTEVETILDRRRTNGRNHGNERE